MRRALFSIVLLMLIAFAPYWVYLPMIIVGVVLFPLYIEAIVLAIVVDALYGGVSGIFVYNIKFALLTTLLVFFAVPLRGFLRFNAQNNPQI